MTPKLEENETSKIEIEFPNQSSILENNEIVDKKEIISVSGNCPKTLLAKKRLMMNILIIILQRFREIVV